MAFKKKKILLIGASQMAIDYAKVLICLNVDFDVITRGKINADKMKSEIGKDIYFGGLKECIKKINIQNYECVINSVGQEQLYETSILLLENGFKKILVEKPGGINFKEIRKLADTSSKLRGKIFIGYNRRFYTSVKTAKKLIEDDGGVSSFNFEFTELSHLMGNSKKTKEVKQNWFLCNSSHVVDMAFYLGGKPLNIQCFSGGSIDWHPIASKFAGAGYTKNGALFSYQANWDAPGRWGVEILTKKNRYIFKPLEKLDIQQIGTLSSTKCLIDDDIDKKFKPGLFHQVKSFLNNDDKEICRLKDHINNLYFYEKILYDNKNL